MHIDSPELIKLNTFTNSHFKLWLHLHNTSRVDVQLIMNDFGLINVNETSVI